MTASSPEGPPAPGAPPPADAPSSAVNIRDGIAAAVRLALHRPARLGRVRLVAVDGPSGSGKTSLAGPLAGAFTAAGLETAVVSTDLLATWEHPFDWWPEWEAGLLQPLAAGLASQLRTMEWVDGRPYPAALLRIEPPDVLVLEGVSAGRAAIAERLSALVWVEVPDAAVRLERAVRRDGEATRHYLEQWQRDEARHFREDGTRRRADVVIRADG